MDFTGAVLINLEEKAVDTFQDVVSKNQSNKKRITPDYPSSKTT